MKNTKKLTLCHQNVTYDWVKKDSHHRATDLVLR